MRDEALFNVEIEPSEDRTYVVVTVAGEVDSSTAWEIDSVTTVLAGWSETRQVVADLGAVTFLDSSGIAALLRCRQACDAAGIDFTVVNVHGMPLTVLHITGVLDHLSPSTNEVDPLDEEAV